MGLRECDEAYNGISELSRRDPKLGWNKVLEKVGARYFDDC